MRQLTGTEKQIAWAEQIRSRILDNNTPTALNKLIDGQRGVIEKRISRGRDASIAEGRLADLEALKNHVLNCESAVWFIDNRVEFNGAYVSTDIEKLLGIESAERRAYRELNK